MTARKKQNDGATAFASGNETNSDNLTVEDVLKALEEGGIRDLQQFIKRELARAKATDKAPRRASMLGPSVGKPSRRGPAQRPVQVPVLIDGVLYDPKDIHRFDGQILHFVAPLGDRPLQAFTGDQWPTAVRTFVQYRNVSSVVQWANYEPGDGSVQQTSPTGGGVVIHHSEFFTDSNFGGDHLWLDWQREWPDLTKVDRGDFWNRQSWNDCISSVSTSQGVGFLVLCEDINLGGASLSIPTSVRDLGLFGFNDRTSSIVWW